MNNENGKILGLNTEMKAWDRQAHIQARRSLELMIAERFTESDGSTKLYMGQQNVFPGLSAWPMPHQAPYKKHLDRSIRRVLEVRVFGHLR